MSQTHSWDLGFDFGAVVDSSGNAYLQTGFVSFAPQTYAAAPGTPVNLSVGDTVEFNVFNTTNGAGLSGYSIRQGSISFSAAPSSQTATSPFNDSNGTYLTSISIGNLSTARMFMESSIFSGGTTQGLPFWNNAASPLTIANNGRFLVSISLTVQGPTSSQTFVVDPEMVVGSVG